MVGVRDARQEANIPDLSKTDLAECGARSVERWHDPGGDAISSSDAMAGVRTHGVGAVPPSDRWHASVSFGIPVRSRADDPAPSIGIPPQMTCGTRGGGEDRSPRGRPQSPGGLRCPGEPGRSPASPPSRRSDRRSGSSDRLCETGRAREGSFPWWIRPETETAKRPARDDGDDPNQHIFGMQSYQDFIMY